MAKEVLLPQLGQSVESCIIIDWKKREGDKVEKGEVICEVETDKSTLEVESTESGTVLKLLYEVGDDVPVFSPIMIVGEPGEKWETVSSKEGSESASRETKPEIKPSEEREKIVEAGFTGKDSGVEIVRESKRRDQGSRVKISPRARRLAEGRGVDYSDISGSGPGGRIIERDILAVLETTSSRVSPVEHVSSREKTVSGIRQVIAERMLFSIQNTAQYTNNTYANARKLLEYRKRLKSNDFDESLKGITIGDLVNYAVVKTLKRFPYMNSLFVDGKIVERDEVNLGFAVDTPRGLYVPVIRNADRLSLSELSLKAKHLAEACNRGTITPDDMSDGTFTVTNLGMFGIESFTPILNPPQVAILGVCSIVPRAVYVDEIGGEVEFVPSIGLSLTLDHRAVDGAPASRFLVALCRAIENIDLLLA